MLHDRNKRGTDQFTTQNNGKLLTEYPPGKLGFNPINNDSKLVITRVWYLGYKPNSPQKHFCQMQGRVDLITKQEGYFCGSRAYILFFSLLLIFLHKKYFETVYNCNLIFQSAMFETVSNCNDNSIESGIGLMNVLSS